MQSVTVEPRLATALTPEADAASVDELRAAALGRLTGQFAHELRNVLTGVRCYLEILAGVPLPGEVGSYLGEIQGGMDRMTDLASMWHDVSRARCASTWANSEVKRLFALLRAAGYEKRMRLRENLDPEVGAVQVEAEVLEAALLALLAELIGREPEAIEAFTTSGRGVVRIRLEALGCRAAPGGAGARLESLAAGGVRLAALEPPRTGYEVELSAGSPG